MKKQVVGGAQMDLEDNSAFVQDVKKNHRSPLVRPSAKLGLQSTRPPKRKVGRGTGRSGSR